MIEIQTLPPGEKVKAPGAYWMTEAQYHADPCPQPSYSNSMGKVIIHGSERHGWEQHAGLNPSYQRKASKGAQSIGSAGHLYRNGRGDDFVVIDKPNYTTKAARAERDEALLDGYAPILRHQDDTARAMADRADEILATYEAPEVQAYGRREGDGEVTVIDYSEGIWRRIRLDFWLADRIHVFDYKTTEIEGIGSPERYARYAADQMHDHQAALYEDVLGSVWLGLHSRIRFYFVVQEQKPPHELAIFQPTMADKQMAMLLHRSGQERFRLALEAGRESTDWPGYPRHVQLAPMPGYHEKRMLDMVEGLE